MAEPSVGEVIDGRYQIEAPIGRGGMGTVWRARHVFTNVRVALKLLEQQYDEAAFERFLAEARAASTIGHPAIVVVNDANRMTNHQLYLAMELLVGKPLRVAMTSGAVGGEEARRIGLELLDALAAAHRRGVIHRDLKPENIFLVSPHGSVKVLDFGIAKVLSANARSTHSGVLGTLEYMAPEQFADASNVDGRADLWAVGIVLYEMIAARRPFGGTTAFEKYEVLMNEDPVPIESIVPVPKEVTAFFARALARERTHRFASAADMASALRALSFSAIVGAAPAAGPTLGTGDAWIRPPSIPPADPLGPTHRATPQSIPPADVPTRATPQYIAPDDVASATRRPGPNPNLSTSPPARKRRALPFAIAGVAVVGVAITIGIVAGSRGADPKRVDKTDGGVVVQVPASDALTVAPGRCVDICKKLAGCNLAQDDCISDCDRKLLLTDCIEKANGCVELSTCIWKWMCSRLIPSGSASCSATLNCHQTQCGGKMDNPCLCACNAQMSPASGYLMSKLMTCRLNAGDDMNRFTKECLEQYTKPCFADR